VRAPITLQPRQPMAKQRRFPTVIPINARTKQVLGYFPKKGSTFIANDYYDWQTKDYVHDVLPIEWKENPIFEAVLKFQGVETTASGMSYITLVVPETEEEFQMKTATFNECMATMTWILGVAKTTWTYERSGNNCYLAPAYLKAKEASSK